MKDKYLKISSIFLLVEGIVMALVVLLVGLSSVMTVLKDVEVQKSGDPIKFVLEAGLVCILFLVTGIMGVKREIPKARILLGAACGIYGIVRIVGANMDISTIIINALSVVASVMYVYGAWKAAK